MIWKSFLRVVACVLAVAALAGAESQPKQFRNWPSGSSPQEIGKRVADRFFVKANLTTDAAIYPVICTWYGALTFARLTGNRELTSRLVERFDQQMTPEISALVRDKRHVDYSMLGSAPFEIYIQTKKPAYLDVGQAIADRQWDGATPDGLTVETRFWIDDMYMITILEVQAYRATGDAKYLDRAATEMVAYLDKLQQPNGLFYHAPDVPFYWGRGNGWVAAGMTELLRSMQENHPQRARVLTSYRKMMATLLKYQGKDGMWRQLIDHPEAWQESSSTGMFTFAMVTGAKNGWLKGDAYSKAARKAWLGLVKYIDGNADVRNVCEGTGKNNNLEYYLQRKRLTGDLHGQAPILWAASALLR